jgi:4-amino-4-deoxy-L-arabinose transferase-like glycosyltransferase
VPDLPAELRPLTRKQHAHGRKVHPLAWILLFGALLRAGLWYSWGDPALFSDDERDYRQLAARLVLTGEYADIRGVPFSLRPPLYPAAIAGVYRCLGLQNVDAVRAFQAGISLLTVLLVYRLGIMAYSRQVALWAAGLCCFYPSLIGYTNLLLSETLFTFLLTAFTWLVLEAIDRQGIGLLVAAGVTMGLAALTRSIQLVFLPLLALYVFVCWRTAWGRRFLAASTVTAAFVLTIAPWAVRNTRLHKTLTFIDVMGGRNAMMGNYEYTPLERSWATFSDVKGEKTWFHVLYREHEIPSPVTQGQLDKIALRHAIEFIWTNPWLTAKRSVVKFFNFWQLERELLAAAREGYFTSLSARSQLLLAVVICGSYAMVLFAAVFGSCCVPPGDARMHWFLVISILFPCAVHTMIFAHSRYHLPVIPLLTVYAAAAITNWQTIWHARRTWRFAIAAAMCLIIGIGWLRELALVDSQAMQHFFS